MVILVDVLVIFSIPTTKSIRWVLTFACLNRSLHHTMPNIWYSVCVCVCVEGGLWKCYKGVWKKANRQTEGFEWSDWSPKNTPYRGLPTHRTKYLVRCEGPLKHLASCFFHREENKICSWVICIKSVHFPSVTRQKIGIWDSIEMLNKLLVLHICFCLLMLTHFLRHIYNHEPLYI